MLDTKQVHVCNYHNNHVMQFTRTVLILNKVKLQQVSASDLLFLIMLPVARN